MEPLKEEEISLYVSESQLIYPAPSVRSLSFVLCTTVAELVLLDPSYGFNPESVVGNHSNHNSQHRLRAPSDTKKAHTRMKRENEKKNAQKTRTKGM